MKKKIQLLLLFFVTVLILGSISESTEVNDNTYDYSWLEGSWVGDGFGGTSEETWSRPSLDGTMMGMYRHLNAEGEITFYEFITLDKNGMRLKHFSPGLVSWESKEDFITFEMIAFSKDKIEMKGLEFEKKYEDEMEIRLKLKRGDKVESEVFKMKRTSP